MTEKFMLAGVKAHAGMVANHILTKLRNPPRPPVGLILGTGWGDSLRLKSRRELSFYDIPGFEGVADLEGHRRVLMYGDMCGVPVVALSGRVHLNESHDHRHWMMVRLQVEMLIRMGVKTIVLTCAAGSLTPKVPVGSLALIDGFVTLWAPPMPLLGGEFCSPEDAIDQDLIENIHLRVFHRRYRRGYPLVNAIGGYAMVRGPFFEGRRYDKGVLAGTGASLVGMSVLPEACVAALYPEVRIVPVAYVTNDAVEIHSHEENQARAKADAPRLSKLLSLIVARIVARNKKR